MLRTLPLGQPMATSRGTPPGGTNSSGVTPGGSSAATPPARTRTAALAAKSQTSGRTSGGQATSGGASTVGVGATVGREMAVGVRTAIVGEGLPDPVAGIASGDGVGWPAPPPHAAAVAMQAKPMAPSAGAAKRHPLMQKAYPAAQGGTVTAA